MATIDPSIALNVKPFSVTGAMERGYQLRDMALQNQANEAKMQSMADEQQAQRTLADLYRSNTGADGTVNRAGLTQGVASSGLGNKIPALQKQWADADKASADVKNTQSQIGERDWKLNKARVDASAGMIASALSDKNATPDTIMRGLQGMVDQGLLTDQQAVAAWREVPTGAPDAFRAFLVNKGMQVADAGKRLEMTTPKYQSVDAGNRVIQGTVNQMTGEFTPGQGAPIVKAPEGFVVGPGGIAVDPGYLNAKKQIAAAGAARTTIDMTGGQKGFDNEMALGSKFKAEPIYKDFQDMKSAYGQIKGALNAGTPIGDTAAATKIMKLLDPDSVVRESELGMAMAAAGRMDRLRNYVQNQISGEKLTPTQRKDFAALADELMAASTQAYNSKRGEYRQLGADYGLNADRALGAEAPAVNAPKKPGAAVPVKSDADYNSLPSGTRFQAPDGSIRVKP